MQLHRSALARAFCWCFRSAFCTRPTRSRRQQKEEFLTKAKITKSKEAKKGVTGTFRVTLSDGTLTHDASVQTIDDYQTILSERSRI